MVIVNGKEIAITGSILRMARVKEEWDEDIEDPIGLTRQLKSHRIRADIFTFIQRLPQSRPRYTYAMEWDSVAALPIIDYNYWFKNQLYQNPRNKIRIAQKKGVTVKLCDFNDELIDGITRIYNEIPIRQGKPFPDFNIDADAIKTGYSTFLDRAVFVGAFFNNELIGFVKLVASRGFMRTMGLLAKVAHRDKAPMNMLIAKAVEVCAERKIPYLVYGKFFYGKIGSDTLQDFKRYLGFESIILPRYYIPLNTWGLLSVRAGLYNGLAGFLPHTLIRYMLRARSKWYSNRHSQ